MAALSEKRAWLRLYIPDLIALGLNASGIVREIRRIGQGGYRYQDMLFDIRQERAVEKYQPLVEKLDSTRVIPKSMMIQSPLAKDTNYKITATMNYYDFADSQHKQKFITIWDTERKSKEDYAADYIRSPSALQYERDIEILDIDIFKIEHHEGWSY